MANVTGRRLLTAEVACAAHGLDCPDLPGHYHGNGRGRRSEPTRNGSRARRRLMKTATRAIRRRKTVEMD